MDGQGERDRWKMSCKPCPSLWSDNMAKKILNRDEVLNQLRKHKPELERQFGVTSMALVGSTARGEAVEDSDIDLLINFDRPATLKTFFGLQFYVEDLLECRVDLITEKFLPVDRLPYYQDEAIYV